MKIKSATLQDFCLFESATVGLDGQGLVWVGGVNKDTDAADSNGSGKSTIFKAITWGLYGKCIDSKGGDEVVREGAKAAIVALRLEDSAGVGWLIKRERRGGTPRLSITRTEGGAESKLPGDRDQLQEVANGLVGLDFDAFRNTVLFGQRDFHRFIMSKDADRKTMLHSILGTMIYRACHANIRAENTEMKQKCTDAETEASKWRSKLEEYDIPALKQHRDDWEALRAKKLKRLAGEARQALDEATLCATKLEEASVVRSKATEMLAGVEGIDALDEKRDAALAEQRRLEKLQTAALAEAAHCRTVHATASERLEDLEGDKCPVCSSDLAGEAPNALKSSLEAKMYDLQGRITAGGKEATKFGKGALKAANVAAGIHTLKAAARVTLAAIGDMEAQARLLEVAASQFESLKSVARAKSDEIKIVRAETNPYESALVSAAAKVKAYRAELQKIESSLEKLADERAHMEFWARGFSDQGLPSFVLDSAMPYITERANAYLRILADGDITMLFSTQRELKSAKGEMRDEIGVTWVIEDKPDYPPSGGQIKKMEIATDLALMDLVATREGAHVDLLLMDEVLDGLDGEGAQRVVALLHELRKTRGTILVISHQDDLADAFEKAWYVVKEGGKSALKS